jgi:hypothetical protein
MWGVYCTWAHPEGLADPLKSGAAAKCLIGVTHTDMRGIEGYEYAAEAGDAQS